MKSRRSRKFIEWALLGSTWLALPALLLIIIFIFLGALPAFESVGLGALLTGEEWRPTKELYGLLPSVLGTLMVTGIALVIVFPVGLGLALFLTEAAPAWGARLIRRALELLAGIPSVVYGFFGIIVLVPVLRQLFGGSGFSAVTGGVVLAIMVLPTMVTLSEDALRAVPSEYRAGSLALGATHWQTVTRVVLPSAIPGISAGLVLAMGRAIGETMAMIMVVGNITGMPTSLFGPVRTLTGNIAIEMKYATGIHQSTLYAAGVFLLVTIIILNLILNSLFRRREARQ
ncbi:MAG: phosphate ABC transporter permease subunit PstC [Bacillota bacterium]